MEGLEIMDESTRMPVERQTTDVSKCEQKTVAKSDKAMDILQENFGNILKIATDMVEIKKMRVASEAVLSKMAEDRKRILAEAEAYALQKRADTSSVVERMNVIRLMMQDFYANNDGNISGEDFCKIITEVVSQMGRVEDGIK